MCRCDRRSVLAGAGSILAMAAWPRLAISAAPADAGRAFLDAAQRMKDLAIAAGDQAFGAVVVVDGRIVGWGPSRVVAERNPNAHAERVALWDAQARLGRKDLTGAMIFSTSRPCRQCQGALAVANVGRMVHGAGIDAGAPEGR